MQRSTIKKSGTSPGRVPASHTLRIKSQERGSRKTTNQQSNTSGPSYGRPGTSVRARTASPAGPRMGGYSLTRKESMRPRYPNYLPEMKARRAVVTKRSSIRKTGRISISMMDEINDAILRDLLNLKSTDTDIPPMPQLTVKTTGHPLYLPPGKITKNFPNMLLSIYRAPTQKILDWDTGSPTIQLENMRAGGGVGPSPSQLPSPESSHSVLLSIRGRNRNRDRLRDDPVAHSSKSTYGSKSK